MKQLIHQKDHDLPPFEQRLVHDREELSDSRLLNSYPNISDGANIFLIRLIPFQVFLKGMDGTSYTLRIPSKSPEVGIVIIFHFINIVHGLSPSSCGVT